MSTTPRSGRSRGLRLVVGSSAVAAVVAAALTATPAVAATAATATSPHGPQGRQGLRAAAQKALDTARKSARGSVSPSLREPRAQGTGGTSERERALPTRGPVQVMLELDDAPAISVYRSTLPRGAVAARSAAVRQTHVVKAAQADVERAFGRSATKARTLYRTHAAYAGIAVATDASRLPALAALPGVKAIHRLTPKSFKNSTTVPLIGSGSVWSGTPSNTGAGVRIGIIDTGVDYTHKNFGGVGTTAAYDGAKATDTDAVSWPQGAVVGGYDFAGDAYAPGDGHDVPVPDANPLDCEGHGSHVAGTAAGRGVTKDDSTFAGPWVAGLKPSDFRIGPGVAPQASIYALKVFGCDGSTNLVSQALDWAADPNGDGDVSDHLDVVNMSLGGDFASPDDPDAVASNNLSAIGTIVVAAAGNAGDVSDVSGSPGNAARVIGVAASDDPVDVLDGLKIDAPTGLETSANAEGGVDNVFAAEESSAYDWATEPGVTDVPVVKIGTWGADPAATNSDGCDPLTTSDAAAVAGKVLLTEWKDASFRCGSAVRAANAEAAGAVGVLYGDDLARFSAGFLGSDTLPAMGITSKGTKAIADALDASTEVRVTMTHAAHNTVQLSTPSATDQVADFSSRGFGTAHNLKPDVSAPGVSVFSTDVGTGFNGVSESGTSMATPHVAGVAALVRKAHPAWTVEQVKAAIMNTAGADVKLGTTVVGPARAGAGRVQVDRAVATPTLAYVKDDAGVVSLSWGDVAVSRDTTLSKTLHVVNAGTVSRSYSVSYKGVVPTPGVKVSVSPSTFSLAAGASTDVRVSVTITAAALEHTLDPTMDDEGGLRSYFSDFSGRVEVATSGVTGTSRVPLYVAPHPASVMTSPSVVGVSGSSVQTGAFTPSGSDVYQGGDLGDSTNYASAVSAFELQGISPRRPDCSPSVVINCTPFADERAGDLRYAGFASDAPTLGTGANPFDPADANSVNAYFAVSTWGPWRTPATYAEYDVYLDTDPATPGPELVAFNTRWGDTSDTMLSALVDLSTGCVVDVNVTTPDGSDQDSCPDAGDGAGLQLLNGLPGLYDTGLFRSDSMFLPVSLAAIGKYLPGGRSGDTATGTPSTHRIKYWVQASTVESGDTDQIGSTSAPLSVDVVSPALSATGDANLPVLETDAAVSDAALTVRRDPSTAAADKPLGLLTLHHLNANGSKAQVTAVKVRTALSLKVSDADFTYGYKPTLTATVSPAAGPSGWVLFRDGTRSLGWAKLSGGKATLTVSGLWRGNHYVRAYYYGTPTYLGSTSQTVRVVVRGRYSATALGVSDRDYHYGQQPPVLTAWVWPSTATGTVIFRDGTRYLGYGKVSHGKVVVRSPRLARGSHYLRAYYYGSGAFNPSTSKVVYVRVR
ncbi:MAG: S8 family serine peptidase [Angustibacter sp.]